MKTVLRLRMSTQDAHYGGNLVDGAKILALFGDAATELLIRHDGDEGLFRAYEKIDFLAPVYAGEFLEIEAEIIASGSTSRKMEFKCYKVIVPRPDLSDSACEVLAERILTTSAIGTCIVPKDRQRHG
ncbi:MAG: hotdog fold domain-containing protein [Acholeplasmataceae bacterium]|nr:hotdog fold thioesterase [Acholeplasmataceae bacterium]